MYLDISVALLLVVTVPAAMVIDLCTRRIPNLLTFPLLAMAILVRVTLQGWPGLALALTGALFAPAVLLLLHAGKGLGMGDLKLAVGIGAVLGPITAVVSMLATAVIGGLLAVFWMLKSGGMLSLLLVGVPGLGSKFQNREHDDDAPAPLTFPYGIAIGLGAFLVLTVRWCTEYDVWFL